MASRSTPHSASSSPLQRNASTLEGRSTYQWDTQPSPSHSLPFPANLILFENASTTKCNDILFLKYSGAHASKHRLHRLFLAQLKQTYPVSLTETFDRFRDFVKSVLDSIPLEELPSYTVNVRTGVLYYLSERFRFNRTISFDYFLDLLQRKIPSSDIRFYYESKNSAHQQTDVHLRSSFSNVKPIDQQHKFAEELHKYQFHVKEQKHFFRMYLKSDDKRTHVCTIDPAKNYSIVELSEDFQRTCNIDFVRDRRQSKFSAHETYDDIFDFRVQFQHDPHKHQTNTIEGELHHRFPSLGFDFKNEHILQPMPNSTHQNETFKICEQLCPYVRYIRRDFGDVYSYDGTDPLFEHFSIYLESSVEYSVNSHTSTCRRYFETHGLVYARLDLQSMMNSGSIDEDLLARKLWDMGQGLSVIAGECTTSESQRGTTYHASDGTTYTAEDFALVQTILREETLPAMLGLTRHATDDEIAVRLQCVKNQLNSKWNFILNGRHACEKLDKL